MALYKPFRTINNKLSTIPIVDGQLIFVVDTKNIYLDRDQTRILLGNSTNYKAGDGISLTENSDGSISINNTGVNVEIKNKEWYINGKATGVIAEGTDGATPEIDETTKKWKINGVLTDTVAEGITPLIEIDNTTKEWIINDKATGVVAEGDTITQDQFKSLIDLLTEINTGITTALKGDV